MREPLLCATTLSSLDAAVVTRRRRRMTSFAFPSEGRAIGRVSTPPTPSATTAARRRVRRLHLRLRLRGLRPERAAAAPPDGKDCIGIASHASDPDCDDGGPGSEFQQADCPYGCRLRLRSVRPAHANACRAHTPAPPGARVALAAAFSIVGCYYYFVTSCELSTGRTRASTHRRTVSQYSSHRSLLSSLLSTGGHHCSLVRSGRRGSRGGGGGAAAAWQCTWRPPLPRPETARCIRVWGRR